jgi:predicted HicB family RNase H-like nuclease
MSTLTDKYTYRVTWSDEDKEFVGLCTEFPSLSWLASTKEKALRGIEKIVREVIEDMNTRGEAVPQPLAVQNFSGAFKVRIPPALHRRLVMEAADSAVSLNRFVSMKLASTETYDVRATSRAQPRRAAPSRSRGDKRRTG